ncbi:MAG TPA: sulfur carrier protein ThiS [Anaeromyxobacter sp.]|nr:sulfur carrier protein ThiS [Anaeromyxobacter sp.]
MPRVLLRLNGELREVPDGTTVAGLLAQLGVKPARVAVVVNEAVVTHDLYAEHRILPGDSVEIVAVMAGA